MVTVAIRRISLLLLSICYLYFQFFWSFAYGSHNFGIPELFSFIEPRVVDNIKSRRYSTKQTMLPGLR